MKYGLVLFFAIALPCVVSAQKMVTTTVGNLELVQEEAIAKLMNAKMALQKPKTMPGFRVQLSSTANRNEALDLKTQFLRRHPDVRAYVTYQQPYFKLRVGDFEQRADASRFMQEIYDSFPGFIVSDIINTSNELEASGNR
jgi:hypothetical protein